MSRSSSAPPTLLQRARVAALGARETIARVASQAGSLTVQAGPFQVVLYPRQQPLSMVHPGPPEPRGPSPLAGGSIDVPVLPVRPKVAGR